MVILLVSRVGLLWCSYEGEIRSFIGEMMPWVWDDKNVLFHITLGMELVGNKNSIITIRNHGVFSSGITIN